MAIKVIIRRKVPKEKKIDLLPLLNRLRICAMDQPGYITGVTLKRVDKPGETIVIGTWQTETDWRAWILNDVRKDIQDKIDDLLGKQTEYEIYKYQ